jgi:hypothetical protein
MYKKTITFEDYNGEKVTEDFYFNLTKAELMEMNFQASGGLENYARSIINTRDTATMMKIYKDLLLKSYGVKTPDGKHFMKTETIRVEFECSPAFSELYTELLVDDKAAADFFNGIIPKELENDPQLKRLFKEGENAKLLPGSSNN